jgi:hypothetical protein
VSYARKGLDGSDVYVFATGDDWVCHECSLARAGDVRCDTPLMMLTHLQAHIDCGHTVPAAALERLHSDDNAEPDSERTRDDAHLLDLERERTKPR